MSTEQQARQRVEASEALKAHKESIFYDWPNWDEHLEWIVSAPESEIIDWAKSIEGFAGEKGASEFHKKGGSTTSDAKAAASRANGHKGGRPRKSAAMPSYRVSWAGHYMYVYAEDPEMAAQLASAAGVEDEELRVSQSDVPPGVQVGVQYEGGELQS